MGKWDKYKKNKPEKNDSNSVNNGMGKTVINWYPGHMAKTKKEIINILGVVDIIIEVIDARVPLSSRIPNLNKMVNGKRTILVFNKYDLCDETETSKWINKYTNEGHICVTCNAKESNDYKKIIEEVKKLMQDVNNKRKEKGLLPKKAKCLIVGVPNVGKSTLINKIAGKSIAGTGNRPGVTKNLSTIKVNEFMDLVDTPGILWPKFESQTVALNLASMTIIKEEILQVEEVAIYLLKMLSEYYTDKLEKNYGISYYEDDECEELFTKISKYKNIPIKGEVDYERVSTLILNDVKQEKLKNITFDRI